MLKDEASEGMKSHFKCLCFASSQTVQPYWWHSVSWSWFAHNFKRNAWTAFICISFVVKESKLPKPFSILLHALACSVRFLVLFSFRCKTGTARQVVELNASSAFSENLEFPYARWAIFCFNSHCFESATETLRFDNTNENSTKSSTLYLELQREPSDS